ncbi:helix-turn-helix domain-containing protein [Flavobacterium sp. IMCC34518]|jgi:excisionase family DNA binding protein|uniref:helix-turn-helix domain-containing protein n=1 Tax=Flavobacterium sp. IMCC34518 TaxID=3003623 RepID=UPI0022AC369F|nr:helix-turn-helix domain-containing protein [Flavobacterium sp. IMCC34518]
MKTVLQLENTTAVDFKNEISEVLENLLLKFSPNFNNQEDNKLLTREETAKMLSVSLVTLWEWTRKDLIPAYRIGNKVRYKKGEVLEALQKMNKFK